MRVRNIIVGVAVGVLLLASAVAVAAYRRGMSFGEFAERFMCAIESHERRYSVSDRVAAILAKKPLLKEIQVNVICTRSGPMRQKRRQ